MEAKGIRFAYRQFGKQSGVPLVFMRHFRGGLDHITDGLGTDHPVISRPKRRRCEAHDE
jgi:hypothetical protein